MAADRRVLLFALGGCGLLTLSGAAAAVFCHRSVREEKEAAARFRADAAKTRDKIAAIPRREREAIVARETLEEIARILPDDKQIFEFVGRLWEFLRESGVQVSSLDDPSSRRAKAKNFEPVTYRIQLEGGLWSILAFLSRLESYERFVRVPRFQLTAGPRPAAGGFDDVRHTVRMDFETYVYNPGKGETKRANIPHLDRKRADLAAEIAKVREGIEEAPYEYRGARGRRDPFVDPRLPSAAGGGAGLPLDEQTVLVDRLRGEVEKLRAAVEKFRTIADLIQRAELRHAVETALSSVGEEVGRAEREGKVTYLPLARRFRREAIEGLASARRSFEAVVAEGPTAEELKAVASAMRERLSAGDLGAALDRFALVAERIKAAEADPTRAPVVAEIRELERRARLAEEFARIPIRIEGVVVRPDGAVAVINGRTVAEGDMLDDELLVRRIGVEEIEFQYRDLVIAKKR